MKLERKIEIMQRIIEKKDETISSLQEENEKIKNELLFEKSVPKEGYDETKRLMDELSKSKAEYEELIAQCRNIKKEYHDKLNELTISTKEYQMKIQDFEKFFNKCSI